MSPRPNDHGWGSRHDESREGWDESQINDVKLSIISQCSRQSSNYHLTFKMLSHPLSLTHLNEIKKALETAGHSNIQIKHGSFFGIKNYNKVIVSGLASKKT